MNLTGNWFFWLFFALYFTHLAVELTLDALNWRELKRHQGTIPEIYRGLFSPEDYRKAIAYTQSKMRFGWVKAGFDVLVLWFLILSGGFHILDELLSRWIPASSLWHLVAYPFLLGGILYVVNLPFAVYYQFVLEEKYGFDFPGQDTETLSGFIINYHETIPRQKERIIIDDYEFDIISVSDTRIEMVKMKKLK